MIVYLVRSRAGGDIAKIFSSRELAEAWINYDVAWYIDSWQVDP